MLCLATHLALPQIAFSQITPAREIVPLDSLALPQWKIHWDMGREAVRDGKYGAAANYYILLLKEKPQIEEARWEYCKILMQLGRHTEASTLLEGLIEDDPYRLEYLWLAGQAALAAGEYNRAVRYLGQVYSQQPEGEEGVAVLQGLIRALMALGREENAFVLMEQLRLRTPDDDELQLELARTARKLGHDEKAAEYYSMLVADENLDREAVIEAATLFADVGREEEAAFLWQALLHDDPKNKEYHQRLLVLYRKAGKQTETLPHLLALLDENDETNPELLLETARVYGGNQGRPDKAVGYYEHYLRLHPDDGIATGELQQARKRIATELLAIVENDGAEQLWQDLSHFTVNRLAIFQLMAEQLEQQGKNAALIKVLEIIYRQPGSNTDELALKLAELHAATGDVEAAYSFYSKISRSDLLTASSYKKKGELALLLGYDVAALDSLMLALAMQPSALSLRAECLRLAGQLGFAGRVEELARDRVQLPLSVDRLPLYLAYFDALHHTGMLSEAEFFASRLLEQQWLSDRDRRRINLERAGNLKAMGSIFASQQVLRSMLTSSDSPDPGVMAALIEQAVEVGTVQDGRALLAYYVEWPGNGNWKNRYDAESVKLFLAYIHLLAEEDDVKGATEELEQYLETHQQNTAVGKESGADTVLLDSEVELCGLYLRTGEKRKCLARIQQYEQKGGLPPELRVLKYVAVGDGSINPEALTANLPGLENGKGGVRELLRMSRQSMRLHQETAAQAFLGKIIRHHPQSLRARVNLADVLARSGGLAEAADLYRALWLENDQETWLHAEYLKLAFRLGRYETVLAELDRQPFASLPVELKVLKARTLYAAGMKKESFPLYEEMLTPSVRERFRTQLAETDIRFDMQHSQTTSFWSSILSYEQPDQFDKLNSLQGDGGFLSMRQTQVGAIAAQLYDSYRWERLIGSEYKARKALEENKYTVAEKQYRKTMEQGQSTEGLKELARIYERLGEYEKQAEIYRYLEKRGERDPGLEESMERNKLAMAPTVGINAAYLEKSGRDGFIDLKKSSAGVSFSYLPGAKSSLQLDLSELHFDSADDGGNDIEGRLFGAAGTYTLDPRTSVRLSGGLQILDSEADSSPVYSFRLNRKFDDLLSGYLGYKRELIDDTVEALEKGVTLDSVLGGLVLEGTTGVTLGAEFEQSWYDDDNTRNRLYIWSSYAIFDDLTTYEAKYSYEMLNNEENDTQAVQAGTDPQSDIAVQPVLPYWSPSEYWRHMLSVKVHHLLKELEEPGRLPSSFSFDLSAGYESESDLVLGGGADIFLEIGGNFLVKGRLFYTDSSDYEEKSASISVMYRW